MGKEWKRKVNEMNRRGKWKRREKSGKERLMKGIQGKNGKEWKKE